MESVSSGIVYRVDEFVEIISEGRGAIEPFEENRIYGDEVTLRIDTALKGAGSWVYFPRSKT